MIELIVVLTIIGLLGAILLPAVQQAREAARRISCANHLRQLGQALLMYHDTHRVLPIQFQTKWPTAVLPELEQRTLYTAYRHELEPWAPENLPVVRSTVAVFLCPSAGPSATSTAWGLADMALSGEFVGSRLAQVTDGLSQTALTCDLQRSEGFLNVWAMGPMFYTIQPATGPHPTGQNVGLADGSVRFLPRHTSQQLLDAIMSLNGGEVAGW